MRTILLADDDLFFQKFYSTKLTEQGFSVDVVSDGEEALEKLKKNVYNLLLLDLVMPKKDGFTVLQEMISKENKKMIPVIVFSTLGQDQDIEKAKQLGAADYIQKTYFNLDELLMKIKKVIG